MARKKSKKEDFTMNELVIVMQNKAVCSSLEVATNFKKNHFHIIRDIETKIIGIADMQFTQSNFGLSEYKDESGKANKMYFMTRDGFSLLAMGFTGKQAMEFKINYINAFNQMEKLLLEKQTQQWIRTRQQGKLTRNTETDTIKKLVEYAKAQGSEHADKLYITYSKLANKIAGVQGRDIASVTQLNNLSLIENIILHVIDTGIKTEKHYKAIYQDCKARLETFKDIAYLAS